MSAPTHYELRVAGHLDPHWAAWFDGLDLIHEPDGTTTLRAVVRDQAELHGLLAGIRDLGVDLIAVAPHDPGQAGDVINFRDAGGHQRS